MINEERIWSELKKLGEVNLEHHNRILELEKGNDYIDENLNEVFDDFSDSIVANMERIEIVEEFVSEHESEITILRDSLIEANKELFRRLNAISVLYRKVRLNSNRSHHSINRIENMQEEINELKVGKNVNKSGKKRSSTKKGYEPGVSPASLRPATTDVIQPIEKD